MDLVLNSSAERYERENVYFSLCLFCLLKCVCLCSFCSTLIMERAALQPYMSLVRGRYFVMESGTLSPPISWSTALSWLWTAESLRQWVVILNRPLLTPMTLCMWEGTPVRQSNSLVYVVCVCACVILWVEKSHRSVKEQFWDDLTEILSLCFLQTVWISLDSP